MAIILQHAKHQLRSKNDIKLRSIDNLTGLSTRICVKIVIIYSGGRVLNSMSKNDLFTYGNSFIGGWVSSINFPCLECFSYFTLAKPRGGAGH